MEFSLSVLAFLLGFSMVIADGSYNHGYGYHGNNEGYPSHVAGKSYGAQSSQHYGHYHYAKTTCADHYKPGITNGYYKVYSVYHMGSMKVYCDFTSEPGMAYTMVMSSSFVGRTDASVAISGGDMKNPFKEVSLASPETSTVKHHVNSNIPNKFAYRQAFSDMERISKASKVWRYTCGAPQQFKDYVRAKVSEVNPITLTSPTCVDVEYMNVNSNSCSNCKANLKQDAAADQILRVGPSSGCGDVTFNTDDELENCGSTGDEAQLALWYGNPVH